MSETLSRGARVAVLACACTGLIFDGIELGLMPVASLSVSRSLLGDAYTPELGGVWFARFTAALMLGAAIGGILLGNLGDRVGRTRAMGISILFYSIFALAGGWVRSQEEMLAMRFLVGLGVGGMWPNGMALVAECWSEGSRPVVSGVMSAGLNFGILLLSQLARFLPITSDSWRWLFFLGGIPAVLGVVVLLFLPESPRWLASQQRVRQAPPAIRELFTSTLLPTTLTAMLVAAIPLVAAWSAGKWMIPWADHVASPTDPGYKATTQGWWALGGNLWELHGGAARSLARAKKVLPVDQFRSALQYGGDVSALRAARAVVPPPGFSAGLFGDPIFWLACRFPSSFFPGTHSRFWGWPSV